mmetsp:Transcript_704/g.2130  ORF Transcript_704/g.2130 Transcript_704/m.2130 type:complete len:223 (-) Transcript_704:906-1574(-)
MRLIKGCRHQVRINGPQVHRLALQGLYQGRCASRYFKGNSVKELVTVWHCHTFSGHLGGKELRHAMDTVGDLLQSLLPVVHRVHTSHVCQENLRGAQVRSRLVETDVLLTRLQGQAVCWLSMPVQGLTNDAARHAPDLLRAACHVGSGWAAKPHRHAKSLHRANHHVSSHLRWGLGDAERQRVSGDDQVCLILVQSLTDGSEVLHEASGVWVLHQSSAEVLH